MPPDERLRPALHDGVAQRMAGIAAALSANGPIAPATRRRCIRELNAAIGELRDILIEDEAGASATAANAELLVRDFVVEAIRNARKHAHPSVIAVSGYVSADRIHVEVLNDGVNSGQNGNGTHAGLQMLETQARRQGGRVNSHPIGPDGWVTELTLRQEGP